MNEREIISQVRALATNIANQENDATNAWVALNFLRRVGVGKERTNAPLIDWYNRVGQNHSVCFKTLKKLIGLIRKATKPLATPKQTSDLMLQYCGELEAMLPAEAEGSNHSTSNITHTKHRLV